MTHAQTLNCRIGKAVPRVPRCAACSTQIEQPTGQPGELCGACKAVADGIGDHDRPEPF